MRMLSNHAHLHHLHGNCSWGPSSNIVAFASHLQINHQATGKVRLTPYSTLRSWISSQPLDLDPSEQDAHLWTSTTKADANHSLRNMYQGLLDRDESRQQNISPGDTAAPDAKGSTWWKRFTK